MFVNGLVVNEANGFALTWPPMPKMHSHQI